MRNIATTPSEYCYADYAPARCHILSLEATTFLIYSVPFPSIAKSFSAARLSALIVLDAIRRRFLVGALAWFRQFSKRESNAVFLGKVIFPYCPDDVLYLFKESPFCSFRKR